MKRLLIQFLLLACALVFVFENAHGQDKSGQGDVRNAVESLRATVESLRAEVTLLRATLAQLELERHRDNIRRIKAEIDMAQAEHAQLTELDRARQQDLSEVEELLTRGDVPAEQRLDAESARSELAVRKGREIAQQSEAVRIRQSELLRRLETEEHAANRLTEAWKLTGERRQ